MTHIPGYCHLISLSTWEPNQLTDEKPILLRETTVYILLCVMCLIALWGERFQCTVNTVSRGLSRTPRSPRWRPGISLSEHIWNHVCITACTNSKASLGICRSPTQLFSGTPVYTLEWAFPGKGGAAGPWQICVADGALVQAWAGNSVRYQVTPLPCQGCVQANSTSW